MAHVRTQIRDFTKNLLEAALDLNEYVVYASRKSAINHRSTMAIVDMSINNDQTREAETMGDARVHVASMYIRVQRSVDSEDALDSALDVDSVLVETAMYAADWAGLLEDEPELIQAGFSDDDAGGRVIGSIVLRFDMIYRIDRTDPETVIA